MLKTFLKRPEPVQEAPSEPVVGFLTTGDALVLVGILKAEYQSSREMADHDSSWLAQAQLLERIIPVIEQSEIIVIE